MAEPGWATCLGQIRTALHVRWRQLLRDTRRRSPQAPPPLDDAFDEQTRPELIPRWPAPHIIEGGRYMLEARTMFARRSCYAGNRVRSLVWIARSGTTASERFPTTTSGCCATAGFSG